MKMYEIEIFKDESGDINIKQPEEFDRYSVVVMSAVQVEAVIKCLGILAGDSKTVK